MHTLPCGKTKIRIDSYLFNEGTNILPLKKFKLLQIYDVFEIKTSDKITVIGMKVIMRRREIVTNRKIILIEESEWIRSMFVVVKLKSNIVACIQVQD